ncbi:MAG TPA: DUF3090 family protein [Dehalococcoidia bacterium]|nr:DUF3090 family protein [Dehalococcoidia bacterium]
MTVELGVVQAVDAKSYGRPGQRTFHLRVIGANSEAADLVLEKQHLVALSMAFEEILSQLGYESSSVLPPSLNFPARPQYEFHVGRMTVGFHAPDATIALTVHEFGEDDGSQATLSFRLTQDQCAALRLRLNEIISAGRPICRLCGQPVDLEGHVCFRLNGHSQQPIPDTDQDAS